MGCLAVKLSRSQHRKERNQIAKNLKEFEMKGLTPAQRIKRLDDRLGVGAGAVKERKRFS